MMEYDPKELEARTKAVETLQLHTEKLREIEEKFALVRRKNAEEYLRNLEEQRKAVLKAVSENKMGMEEAQEALRKYDKLIEIITKSQETKFRTSSKEIRKDVETAFSGLVSKIGLDLQKLSIVGLALWVVSLIDARRILANWGSETVRLFGDMGRQSYQSFERQFWAPVYDQLRTFTVVSDHMRTEFLKGVYEMGLQIRGITPYEFVTTVEKLTAIGSAFNIGLKDMAGTLFHFQDVFKLTTSEAAKRIVELTDLSLGMHIAPSRFLTMVKSLTDAFKLQNISIKDVTEVFKLYYRNAQMGIEMSTELTNITVRALGALKEGRIAALLALQGRGGRELGRELVGFFRGQDIASRLVLVQEGLKILQKRFPEALKNEFASVRLVMHTFGIKEFEVGVRLHDALKTTVKGGIEQRNSFEEAINVLTATKSLSEQALISLANLVNMIIKIIGLGVKSIAMFTGHREKIDLITKITDERTKALQAASTGQTTKAMEHYKKIEELERKLYELTNETTKEVQNLYDLTNAINKSAELIETNTAKTAMTLDKVYELNKVVGQAIVASGPGGAVAAKGLIEAIKRLETAVREKKDVTNVEINISPDELTKSITKTASIRP